MPRTLNDVIASLPADRRARIEARVRDLIAEEMSLQDLRKAIGRTRTAIAKRLEIDQAAVARLEKRTDMYISSLRSVIEAMGGELQLTVHFKDRPPLRVEALGATTPRQKRDRRRAA